MYDYNEFFKNNPVNVHDDFDRHTKIASLCKGKVCDIGCGTGSLTDYFKGDYFGFDISSVAVEKARSVRRKDAKFDVLDFESIDSFDFFPYKTIVMSEFLEHINSDEQIFKSIQNTASVGTRIIISVPNGHRVLCDEHVREFTIASLRNRFKDIGFVTFYNWSGEKNRIIMTVDVGISKSAVLTLGVIAKNEEKGIEKCILSSIEHVDDVVVFVDDSTTDETEEIARQYTDNVFKYTWQDDFSLARNLLLEKVETEWVLFLDAHEYLNPVGDVGDIFSSNHDAFMCEITLDNKAIIRYPRLHQSRLRYEDKVHNKLVCKNLGNQSAFTITHDRIGGQSKESTEAREAQRHDMLTRIMGKQLKENKKNIRALMHLGLHFHARREFKKALKYYYGYLKYSEYVPERWFIRFNIVNCLMQLRKPIRAEYHAMLLDRESPNRWETYFVRGITLMAQKKYSDAINYFVKSLEVNKQEAEYKPMPKDYAFIWNNIGEAYFKIGCYFEASEAFNRASERSNDDNFKNLLSRRAKLMREMASSLNKK